ncbi:hypothetical protein R6V09_03955 [Streptomyces sp. W16]|uniref:hypothetical protein n=1 Tax=Streptomyces sp. W16 TaxID=3076631 RepID=UPI00295BABB0|nr:hypothetical protein [Streptomyces sp. W16]MDV9169294.1 hypothetical protein [Streptomyces sp. W16]
MVYRRPVRLCCGALATGLLLAGCSGAAGGGSPEAAGSERASTGSGTSSSPTPSATGLDFTADPARAPKTSTEGERLARAVAAAPVNWGPGFVRRTPYETAPGSWPELDANCVWERRSLPSTVLATLTRYSELPAEGGKGPIRVAAVVTVHRTVNEADWEMSETLEEALRCPDQQLREGERITGLASQGSDFGILGNLIAEDMLTESGNYYSDELGGPYFYSWMQSRLGQVTVAAVGKGSKGRSAAEVSAALVQGAGAMISRAESELETTQ